MNEEIKFTKLAGFQEKQILAWKKLRENDTKYLLYGGSAGGGKSYFLRWAAVGLGFYYAAKYHLSGIPIGLFSEDYPTLKDRQIARIKREFPGFLGELKDTRDEGYVYQIAERYGGAKILLRNLDDPSKYASTEFAAELVEELTKNPLQTFEDLRFRLRYPGVSDVRFVAASNPGSIGHEWVKRYFIDKKAEHEKEQDKFVYVPATVYDNEYVDPSYVKQLESLPEAKRKAFLEGSWDIFAGQVFSEFSLLKHVIKPMVPNVSFDHYISMDWGYSEKSAFSAHLHCVIKMKTEDGENFQRVITYKEWYGNQKTPREWAALIYTDCLKLGIKPLRGYGDPAIFNTQTDGSRPISTLLEDEWKKLHGKQWIILSPGGKNRIARVATLHNWLSLSADKLSYWMMTENNTNLIRTLPALVYDKNRIDDVDTSQEDHCLVEDTLVLTTQGWKEIKTLPFAKITGYDKIVMKLVTESGKILRCTPNHKILTPYGWITASKLTTGSLILSLCPKQSKSLIVKDSINVGITTHIKQKKQKVQKDCTELYGNFIIAPFQMVGISTIGTGINQTIPFPISNSLKKTNISLIIPLIQQKKCGKHEVKTHEGLVQKVIENSLKSNAVEQLRSVTYEEKRENVYDIGVEHPFHGFIVNGGLIVHNCYDDVGYFLSEVKFIALSPGPHSYGKVEPIKKRYNEKQQEMGLDIKEFSNQFRRV